ncbi:hypothetical protein E2C01_037996 [Portunus trituberculatus]|uniref:Uncharacterized protein n=1 Tax=Portunus trituberculatus TaxID=210409 RepID=A0A5B7FGS6_PORTR|nr:hypothetical protein [Portunus trituberculatus]
MRVTVGGQRGVCPVLAASSVPELGRRRTKALGQAITIVQGRGEEEDAAPRQCSSLREGKVIIRGRVKTLIAFPCLPLQPPTTPASPRFASHSPISPAGFAWCALLCVGFVEG